MGDLQPTLVKICNTISFILKFITQNKFLKKCPKKTGFNYSTCWGFHQQSKIYLTEKEHEPYFVLKFKRFKRYDVDTYCSQVILSHIWRSVEEVQTLAWWMNA